MRIFGARRWLMDFADQPPARSESVEEMTLFVSSPGVECYLARVDGKVAGGGALSFWNGMARLFCASTLRQFRGRGVQTGLLQTRLVRAAESGSDMATCLAGPEAHRSETSCGTDSRPSIHEQSSNGIGGRKEIGLAAVVRR